MIKILGIAGSLRKASFNRGALRAAKEECPDGAEIEIFDLTDIPLFNQDIEMQMPSYAKQFKDQIRSSDAILFVTPEYNYSVSGILKNALDWGSRPYSDNSWGGKAAAIMSASPSLFGGARAQYHLRQMLVTLNVFVLNRPEVMIMGAHKKFDKEGNLTDEETEKRIARLVEALVEWTTRLKRGEAGQSE